MKKGLLIVLMLLLCINLASASIIVILGSADTSGNSVTLHCNGTSDSGVLTKVEFWTDTTGTFEINVTDSSLASQIESVSTTIENIPNGNYEWNCRFYNGTANDAVNATAGSSESFNIDLAGNIAPQFINGPIANVAFPEDTNKLNAFDLDNYFSDNDSLTYDESGNTHISVTIHNGQVSFSAAANWSGSENITFTASDGSLTNTTNGIYVTVNAVDDAPYLTSQIPNQSWYSNYNKTIDLSDYFADVDSSSLGYTSSNPAHITVYIDNNNAKLVPEEDWVGNTTITFYANDTYNSTASNIVNLNIKSDSNGNHPPSIDSHVPILSVISMKETETRIFSIMASDDNTDNLTYSWQVDGKEQNSTANEFTFSNPSKGERKVKAIASDGNLTSQYVWTVNVKASINAAEETIVTTNPTDVESILEESSSQLGFCGDGNVDEGEDCSWCDDAACKSNEICENKVCKLKPSLKKIIIIIVIVTIVILGLILLLYKLNTNKQELNTHRGGIKENEKVNMKDIKIKPVSDVNDFYEKKQKEKEPEIPKSNESALESFIRNMRNKGHTDQEISEKLKNKGWPEWQIDVALKNIK